MAEIAPAILCDSEQSYKDMVERYQGFARRVHIDITDGNFAPAGTIGVGQLWWPEGWQVDIHAMVSQPSIYVDAFLQMKPSMVIFHAEAEEDLTPSLQALRAGGIKAGVALLRPTVPSTVQQYITLADHALVFSGTLGHYGGTASLMQLEKVRLIRNIRPEIEIGWDGGANFENIYSLSQGGVNVINCGSAISSSANPAEAYQQLLDEVGKHSVV